MTSKFDYDVCSIKESSDLVNITTDELQSSLLVYKQRMNNHVVEEHALQMEYADDTGRRGCGRGAYRGRGRGHGRSAFNKSIVECYHCHDLWHFQYECPKRGKESRAHFAKISEEMLLMTYIKVQKDPSEEAWFLDSGCSNHMCGKKEFFNTLNEDFRESVKLGNNTYLNVMGKGGHDRES
ncbi:hypothetical protein F0562_029482 [Nyssa sinensis]|uniref:Retrovirus-related Pol polyprotein from transposon TNT 1-94-like beta-barrel domain-containing protein n=1 Tax=Nyssa sinensis TaxID=561372 RepID=A0A5J5B395_9ASTE|nr:hypothetical protein F0562_029482 [Nyssa sinensis]